MPQPTAQQSTPRTPQTWDRPNLEASTNDIICRPGYVTLRILGRINYDNGNVVLLCGMNTDNSSLYQNFLLSADDVVIAEPELHYGDIVSRRGTYFSFDTCLSKGVAIKPVETFANCRLRAWDVLVNGQTTGDTVWETEKGCQRNGINYRSVHQAANVAAEEWAIRQADPELEAIF
jgi:hypothetical protein